jgi:hypothetical protein
MLFEYVGSPTGTNAFTWVERSWLRFRKEDKYGSKLGTYSWLNRKIQIHHNPQLPNILIEGVFDNPEEVLKLQCGTTVPCNYDDTPFPVTGDIEQLIVQSILTIDLGILQQAQPATEIPVNVEPERTPIYRNRGT